ncbi:MAG: hypothetical protein IJ104_04735 [Methanobrevibacter sp.]|nr:hypothetical protein [Methanobrevibacter sp.]
MKFKKVIVLTMLILAILTCSAVSAVDDNSIDSNLEISEEDNIESVDNELELQSNSNDNAEELEQSNEDILANSDENILQSNPNDLTINFPKQVEFHSYDDEMEFSIYLPKNSKGVVSIYKDASLEKQFNLSDNALKTGGISGTYNVHYIDNAKNDEYKVYVNIYYLKFSKTTFTVKYDDGINIIEKSALVDVTYRLGCNPDVVYGQELDIINPYDLDGKIYVEIDGKKFTATSRVIPDDVDWIDHYVKFNSALTIGKHKVVITYYGDKVYPAKTVECDIIVAPKIIGEKWQIEQREKISLQLPKNAKGSLVLYLYNSKNKIVKKFTKKFKKGKASLTVPKNFYGKFSKAVIKYNGKDYKVKKVVVKNIIIKPIVKVPKYMLQGEKKYVSIKLPGKKGVLKLYVSVYKKGKYKTKVYSKKLVNGKAKISLSKLKVRDDIINIRFIETLKSGKKVSYYIYERCEILKPLKIQVFNPYTESEDVEIYAYKSGGKALAGKYITIKINNKFVKKVKTNKNGYVAFSIPTKYKSSTFKLTAHYKKNIASAKIKFI